MKILARYRPFFDEALSIHTVQTRVDRIALSRDFLHRLRDEGFRFEIALWRASSIHRWFCPHSFASVFFIDNDGKEAMMGQFLIGLEIEIGDAARNPIPKSGQHCLMFRVADPNPRGIFDLSRSARETIPKRPAATANRPNIFGRLLRRNEWSNVPFKKNAPVKDAAGCTPSIFTKFSCRAKSSKSQFFKIGERGLGSKSQHECFPAEIGFSQDGGDFGPSRCRSLCSVLSGSTIR